MLRFLFKKRVKFLTGNVIKSAEGRYVAYFDQFPELVAQGSSEDDVKERLVRGLLILLERKSKKAAATLPEAKIEVKHFELAATM